MSEPLFVSQAKLENGVEQGDITFDDNVLTILAEQRSYEMVPAARVLSLLDGEDEAGLIGHVWTVRELVDRGAEHFQDSLLLGDTAYQCEAGFVAAATIAGSSPASPPTAVPSTVPVAAPATPAAATTSPVPVAAPVAVPVAAPVAAPVGSVEAAGTPTTQGDMDLLTDFLLKNL